MRWIKIYLGLVAFMMLYLTPSQAGDDPFHSYRQKAESYFSHLQTLSARFTQRDSTGASVSGRFILSRPGKFRLDYDPPTKLIVVCDGINVTTVEPGISTPTIIPLEATPIFFILGKTISLSKEVTITSAMALQNGFSITVVKTAQPEAGSMTLIFSNDPIQLTEWVVNDAHGKTIHVTLHDLVRHNNLFSADLFRLSNT